MLVRFEVLKLFRSYRPLVTALALTLFLVLMPSLFAFPERAAVRRMKVLIPSIWEKNERTATRFQK